MLYSLIVTGIPAAAVRAAFPPFSLKTNLVHALCRFIKGLAGVRCEGEITHPLRDFTQGVDCGLRALLMTYRKDEIAALPVEARNDQEGL